MAKFRKTIRTLQEMPLPSNGTRSSYVFGDYEGRKRGDVVSLCRICMRPRVEHVHGSVADCLELLMHRCRELETLWRDEAASTDEMARHALKMASERRSAGNEWRDPKRQVV